MVWHELSIDGIQSLPESSPPMPITGFELRFFAELPKRTMRFASRNMAEAAGVTDRQFQEAMKVKERRNTGMLSFESYMQNGITYETNLATEDIVYPVDASQMKQTLSRYLRPNEMEALSWRYGLNDDDNNDKTASAQAGRWGEAMSFVEVGKQMKVSAEYGRRLCHAALEKLRSAAEEGTLEPAILGA